MSKAARPDRSFAILSALIVLFIICSGSSAQSAGSKSESANELNARAIDAINNENYDSAIDLLMKAIELKPDFADAHVNLGTAHLLAGRPSVGLVHVKKGLEINPTSYKGYNQLGVVYDKLGQLDLAIEALEKTVKLKPDYAFGYVNLGKAYLFADRLKPAEEALEKGLSLQPTNETARLHLAVLYAKQRRFKQAATLARQVAEKNPADEHTNLLLCKIFLLANDRDAALSMYQSFKATNAPLADQMFRSIFGAQVLNARPK